MTEAPKAVGGVSSNTAPAKVITTTNETSQIKIPVGQPAEKTSAPEYKIGQQVVIEGEKAHIAAIKDGKIYVQVGNNIVEYDPSTKETSNLESQTRVEGESSWQKFKNWWGSLLNKKEKAEQEVTSITAETARGFQTALERRGKTLYDSQDVPGYEKMQGTTEVKSFATKEDIAILGAGANKMSKAELEAARENYPKK